MRVHLYPVRFRQESSTQRLHVHDVWKSQDADDRLETELWEMPHSCGKRSQQRVLEFFQKHL